MVNEDVKQLRKKLLEIQYEKALGEYEISSDIGIAYRTYRNFMDKPDDTDYQGRTFRKIKRYIRENT